MINVGQIDKDLRPYLDPNDRFSQDYILDLIKDKEVSEGICRALALFWLVDCVKVNAKAPNECLYEMKKNGQSYFKQLGNAQKTYQNYLSNKELGNFGSMLKMIGLASKQALSIVATSLQDQGAMTASELADAVANASAKSRTVPRSVLIRFSMKDGGHCIASIEQQSVFGSKWYIFDPNFGVLIVDSTQHRLKDVLGILWKHYSPGVGFAYGVV
jgi:Yersinia/Haemophilus virulence surface antigen